MVDKSIYEHKVSVLVTAVQKKKKCKGLAYTLRLKVYRIIGGVTIDITSSVPFTREMLSPQL